MAKITGKKSLEKWLVGRDSDNVLAIKVRSTLRVAPLVSENWRLSGPNQDNIAIVLPILRAAYASLVAAGSPTNEAQAAARAAATAAEAAANTGWGAAGIAAQAVVFAARAAGDVASANMSVAVRAAVAASALTEFWNAVNADCLILGDGVGAMSILRLPLWHGERVPDEIDRTWHNLHYWFNIKPNVWGFWRDWYQKVLDGQYQNPDLLYDIAVLPNSDWEAGPAVIAERIAGLQAKYLSAATPLAEVLRLRESTGLIYAEAATMPDGNPLDQLLDMIRDALADAVDPAGNKLREHDPTTAILRRLLDKYSSVPWRVHQDCIRALEALENEIKGGSLPRDDTRIEALRRTLIDVAISIRTAIPSVKTQYAAELQTRFEEMPPERKAEVLDGAIALPKVSEAEFGEAVSEAGNTVGEAKDAEGQKVALYNLSRWLGSGYDLLKAGGKFAAENAAKGAITATIAVAINALAYSYRIGPYQDVPAVARDTGTSAQSQPSTPIETTNAQVRIPIKKDLPKPADNNPKPSAKSTLPPAERPRTPKGKGR